MLRLTVITAAACAALLGTARADVLYQFVPTSYAGGWSGAALSFDLTDAAAQGTFSLTQKQEPFWTGGSPGLSSLLASAPRLTDFFGLNGGSFTMSLTLGTGGAVLGDSLNFLDNGGGEELRIDGTTATYSTDAPGGCYNVGACTVTGYWSETPVPEPASLALLGTGLLLLGVVRRSRG